MRVPVRERAAYGVCCTVRGDLVKRPSANPFGSSTSLRRWLTRYCQLSLLSQGAWHAAGPRPLLLQLTGKAVNAGVPYDKIVEAIANDLSADALNTDSYLEQIPFDFTHSLRA